MTEEQKRSEAERKDVIEKRSKELDDKFKQVKFQQDVDRERNKILSDSLKYNMEKLKALN